MKVITIVLRNYINCKQEENENLISYTKKFKVVREVFNLHLGRNLVLNKIIKNDKNYNENDTDTVAKLLKEVDERLATYLYLENSNKKKYTNVLKNLNSQQSLKNDQYPKSILNATSVLSKYKQDQVQNNKYNNNNNNNNKKKQRGKK